MNQLETLLNTLLKMGWKPKGREGIVKVECLDDHLEFYNEDGFQFWFDYIYLVSINSGLWQFLCENKLVKQSQKQRVLNPSYWPEGADCDWDIQSNEYQYRLLESALVPEEELVEFLVDNIRIDG